MRFFLLLLLFTTSQGRDLLFSQFKKTDKESQEAKQESELKDVVPFDCDAINSIHLLFTFSVTLNDHEIKV